MMDRGFSFLVILLMLFTAIQTKAQSSEKKRIISATILGKDTEKSLPFTTIYNKRLATGTASNLEGYFVLPNNRLGDTIIISYLGYQDEEIIVTKDFPDIIYLNPRSSVLDQIVVVADDDYLYDLVSKLRKNKKTKSKHSKTYFFLETEINNTPIEIIESYYNGKYSNLGIDKLNIKKGRIGLKPVQNRYYRSTESSKLFSIHDVFARSNLFPANPLSIKKKDFRNHYELDLKHSFIKDETKIFVIDFYPKNEKGKLFSGTIWLDNKNNKLIKISLKINDARIHPFVPIGYNTIEGIDMNITKVYKEIDGQQFINNIDFAYNVHYKDKTGNLILATTKAFTKAYDYTEKFTLPKFDFSTHYHEDYRNITATQYDSLYWNRTTEFRFYDRLEEVDNFMVENKIDNRLLFPTTKRDSLLSQLQFPYILWDENRFTMSQVDEEKLTRAKSSIPFEVDRYNLNVKLYLDMNTVQDTTIYQLCSILDPVDSYYYFTITPTDLVFMNIYFDIMEVQKRKFETELRLIKHIKREQVEKLYEVHMNEFGQTIESYITKTKRGKNKRELEKWNQYIIQNLNVDNLKYFKIDEDR